MRIGLDRLQRATGEVKAWESEEVDDFGVGIDIVEASAA